MLDCVFVKYRDILKFENFHTNHPVIYLPFVIYNWLALGILPNLYSHEDYNVENSRIELLQKNNYLLDVLATVINCVLNIEIKLNENIYKQNIQYLKKIKNLSRDVVLPFITIENYMSIEDSKLFIDKISQFFPHKSIVKSIDAIPCSKLYSIISDKLSGTAIWGSSYWVVIHLTAFTVDKMPPGDLKDRYQESLCSLPGFLDLLLPCSLCRYHYSSLYKYNEEEDFARPFQLTLLFEVLQYAKRGTLFDFYSILHNNCKPMDNSESLDVEYYKRVYEQFFKNTQQTTPKPLK